MSQRTFGKKHLALVRSGDAGGYEEGSADSLMVVQEIIDDWLERADVLPNVLPFFPADNDSEQYIHELERIYDRLNRKHQERKAGDFLRDG